MINFAAYTYLKSILAAHHDSFFCQFLCHNPRTFHSRLSPRGKYSSLMVQAIGCCWYIEEDLQACKALGLDSYRFVGKAGHFTAHHEWRVPKGAWRAHRHIRNHVHVLRLVPNYELAIAVLEQAAQALQAHLT